MPPFLSRPYPLTAGLSHCLPPVPSKTKPLTLGSSSPLAKFQNHPIDPELKNVVKYLKEPLKLISPIFHRFLLCVRIVRSDFPFGEQYSWELTVKETGKSPLYLLDALGVIHQGLFHSKVFLDHLKRFFKDGGNDAVAHHFSEADVEELRKLKKHLLGLSNYLDCVLLYYSNMSSSCMRIPVDEIRRCGKKIYKILNKLNPAGLQSLFGENEIRVTEEDILCSVLGLKDEFAHRLKDLSEYMRNHRSDMHYLLCFMGEQDDSSEVNNFRDREELSNRLRKMGFTENRSIVVAKWIAEQPFPDHKSILAWAENYIEIMFNYDIFLNDEVKNYPYEKKLDTPFSIDVSRDNDEDDTEFICKISVVNTTRSKAKSMLEGLLKERKENPGEKLLYHGTDHKSAKDIMENGINLGLGKRCCDFSNGGGFYLAEAIDFAAEWSSKFQAAAILVFSISSEVPFDQRFKCLDLSSKDRHKDRKTVVEFCQGDLKKMPIKLRKEYDNAQYVYGPVSRDGTKKNPAISSMQICVRKQDMAKEIGAPVACVFSVPEGVLKE